MFTFLYMDLTLVVNVNYTINQSYLQASITAVHHIGLVYLI
jgi:hypothetical protein